MAATSSGNRTRTGKRGARAAARGKRPRRFTAATADPYELYQLAVNSPEEDAAFLRRAFRAIRGRRPLHLREDFCGTALLCSEWVKSDRRASAEGFDLDPVPLAWGRERNLAPVGRSARRVALHCADVRSRSDRPPDVRCAHNFSWSIFKARAELVDYFRAACEDLAADGMLSLDIHGGPESMEEMEEIREMDEGFDYVWDQVSYSPVTGDYLAHIHFRFRDGTELSRAFTYDWRLWYLTEVADALRDAGFARVETWWEGTDEDGESGDGNFQPDPKGDNCPSWITYVLGIK